MDLYEILFSFMIYGFIGWFWETPYVSIRQRKYVNRGFLNGPFIPIYGFGALFMILSEGFLRPILPTNDILQFLVLMLYAAVMSSILEYATSYVLEQAFHTRWWDYSEKRFHLKGRICLSYSICWGFVGFGIIKWIHPVVTNLISSIPLKFGIIVVIVYCIIFSLDVIVTFKDLISLKSVMAELLVLTTELKDKVVEGFSVQKEKLSDSIETKQVKIKEEILHMKAQGEAVISEKQDSLMKNYNLLLEKSKRYSRFYYAFPKASSNKFRDLIDVVRKNIKR